jgi:hypothetical protein
VKTLWKGNALYVLMHVHDDVLDDTASDPWQKDSVEIYVDAGNYKNGAYRPDDTQIRINYKNEVSFGTGDSAAQQARLVSATSIVEDGCIVRHRSTPRRRRGPRTRLVNDAANGARQGLPVSLPTAPGVWAHRIGRRRLLEADQTVPKLQLRRIVHLTATDADGYHGLTAEVAGITATDAFDDPSWLTITSNAPEILPIGRNVVTWTVTDLSGNTSTRQQTIFVHARVLTSLKYTGSRLVRVNTRSRSNWFTPSAVLSARRWACEIGQPIRFTLDRNPVTGEAVPTVLGIDNTNGGGVARLRVSSNKWLAGTYTLPSSTKATIWAVSARPRR